MAPTLRELRTAKGWSQTTLARMVGVSQTTIWYIERGLRRPGPATSARIAQLLGVPQTAIDWRAGQRPTTENEPTNAPQGS